MNIKRAEVILTSMSKEQLEAIKTVRPESCFLDYDEKRCEDNTGDPVEACNICKRLTLKD